MHEEVTMTSKNEAEKTPIIRDNRLNPTLKKILPLTNPSTNTPTNPSTNTSTNHSTKKYDMVIYTVNENHRIYKKK
jgi:hypothetical protein